MLELTVTMVNFFYELYFSMDYIFPWIMFLNGVILFLFVVEVYFAMGNILN